jgi:hypothetical protein
MTLPSIDRFRSAEDKALLVSLGLFIRSEIQNVDQVHTVTGQGIHRLTLTPGKYEIYVDPGGPYINV